MELAHEIPLAGHIGKEKTRCRILRRLYWPTLYKDVKEYCKCCLQCQKSNNKGVQCVPLIPLPIVGERFKRIAMDIIGPLPKSRSGNTLIKNLEWLQSQAVSRSIATTKQVIECAKCLPNVVQTAEIAPLKENVQNTCALPSIVIVILFLTNSGQMYL